MASPFNIAGVFTADPTPDRPRDDDPPCYRRGTLIRGEFGDVTIEALRIGDRVATLSGFQPIRWIGRRTYSARFAAGNRDVSPIRIRAGALAQSLPQRDLWVSPGHAMYLDGMLIAARDLVNGVSIVQEDVVEEINYIHLEFASHELIYAEGAVSESFVDDENRVQFDNVAEYWLLYPRASRTPARYGVQRVEEGVELEAVRQRLRQGAAAAVFAEDEGRISELAQPAAIEFVLEAP